MGRDSLQARLTSADRIKCGGFGTVMEIGKIKAVY
jgi:hypothetical protein